MIRYSEAQRGVQEIGGSVMKRLWMVRLGKFGEQEAHALATGELATGWITADLAPLQDRQAILGAVEAAYPTEKSGTLQNWAVQLNQLRNEIRIGDLTVTPLKTTGQVAVGEVVEGYRRTDDGRPALKVKWLRTDLPRDAIKQDLLYSLGASQTVCEIARNEAAERILAAAKAGKDPGPLATTLPKKTSGILDAGAEPEESVDLAINAQDQIERSVAASFSGHAFTQLIAEILKAQGFQARVSPPGSDKGVDIVAGQGTLGFDRPLLVVQVKSGGIVADQPTLQSLLGSVQDTHADYGLLVSWSGFTQAVRQRTNDLYFRVRLWGRAEVMDALLSVYDRLPEEIRTTLPLRRIWALVPTDGEAE
ncbi:restriction endonuclease [Faunimonas sp. B44]|uniref:restriction endonuclease n=1 Tax=Faunimonas sp. B44 TaxID=3461493 RepID=UPI0040442E55